MTKNLFQSKSGKSFDDVRALIGSEYTLKRSKHNTKKFVLSDSNEKEQYFKFTKTMGDLYDEIESLGLEKFLKEYYIEDVDPVRSSVKQKVKEQKVKKEKIAAARVPKKTASEKKQIEILTEKKTNVVLELMSFKIVRGSEEHKKLKNQLYNINKQLKELNGFKTWAESNLSFSSNDLQEAKRIGAQKVKERKEKLIKKKKAINGGGL